MCNKGEVRCITEERRGGEGELDQRVETRRKTKEKTADALERKKSFDYDYIGASTEL
jgi:hypothetical protein